MTEQQDWQRVAAWLREADGAVAFTGAGISTESGIPDYRSPGGIWARSQPVLYQDFLASGSSLVVEPAASLPRVAHSAGARPVIVNRDATGQDATADLVIHTPIGRTLGGIDGLLAEGEP